MRYVGRLTITYARFQLCTASRLVVFFIKHGRNPCAYHTNLFALAGILEYSSVCQGHSLQALHNHRHRWAETLRCLEIVDELSVSPVLY